MMKDEIIIALTAPSGAFLFNPAEKVLAHTGRLEGETRRYARKWPGRFGFR